MEAEEVEAGASMDTFLAGAGSGWESALLGEAKRSFAEVRPEPLEVTITVEYMLPGDPAALPNLAALGLTEDDVLVEAGCDEEAPVVEAAGVSKVDLPMVARLVLAVLKRTEFVVEVTAGEVVVAAAAGVAAGVVVSFLAGDAAGVVLVEAGAEVAAATAAAPAGITLSRAALLAALAAILAS